MIEKCGNKSNFDLETGTPKSGVWVLYNFPGGVYQKSALSDFVYRSMKEKLRVLIPLSIEYMYLLWTQIHVVLRRS